jgi:hypothetical protein
MEYGRLKPLRSDPVVEPTAVTMQSIKEILAAAGSEGLLMESKHKATAASPGTPQKAAEQRVNPPRFVPLALPKDEAPPAPARQTLASRLAARLFGSR